MRFFQRLLQSNCIVMDLNDDLVHFIVLFTVKKAPKASFLLITISNKECGLKPRYLQFAVGHEKRGLKLF